MAYFRPVFGNVCEYYQAVGACEHGNEFKISFILSVSVFTCSLENGISVHDYNLFNLFFKHLTTVLDLLVEIAFQKSSIRFKSRNSLQ